MKIINLLALSLFLLFFLNACTSTGNALREVTIGMSRNNVIQAIGKPDAIEVINSHLEKWYYKPYLFFSFYQYQVVVFDHGRVSDFCNAAYRYQILKDMQNLPVYKGSEVLVTPP